MTVMAEAMALHNVEIPRSVVAPVYNYWLNKRQRMGRALIIRLKVKGRLKEDDEE